MKRYLLTLLLVLVTSVGIGATTKPLEICSPNGKIKAVIYVDQVIRYAVFYGKDRILDNCSAALLLPDETLGVSPKLLSAKRGSINEQVRREIPLKNAVTEHHCNTLRLNFAGHYAVEFRLFDNGLAYRFITDRKGELTVLNEDFTIGFPADYTAYLSQVNNFRSMCEEPYSTVRTASYGKEDPMSYLPVLIQTDKPYKILLAEADLHDYPCMFVKSTGTNALQATFPPVPTRYAEDGDRSRKIVETADYIAKTSGTRSFPWRMMVITTEDKQLLENEMVYLLSAPCVLEDCSWIHPGQISWDWWNGMRLTGVDFRAGRNQKSYEYYIDFASKYGIPYIIMDEGWAATTQDPFTANPDIDLPELIRYGKQHNVKIILWLTWTAVDNHMDLFEKYAEMGIAGVKIDFMDRGDQWMVNYYERVVKEAAKHKLLVDFHGSFTPKGLERRYPNLISYEGVRGMEQGGSCKPDNSNFLPFIRNAVGAMDFTPGSMFSAQPEDNRSSGANPMGSGTRAYQMALYVVFESGLQMLSDNPVLYYREHPCTEFITGVPTTWDETKVLHAVMGESVLVARRKGDLWFIGGIANSKGCTAEFRLDFLPADKTFTLNSFEDGINADLQATDYKQRTRQVDASTTLTIHMTRNGGWAGCIKKLF
ncbi:MAG: glycoside hydrolase family 97 protein [Alistipes sp.]